MVMDLGFRSRYRGMYPSVGGSDEFIRLFLFQKTVSKEEMEALQVC